MSDTKKELELRSADTNRKYQWMILLAKDPDLAQLFIELSEFEEDEKKMIQRNIRSMIDSMQLYELAKQRKSKKEDFFDAVMNFNSTSISTENKKVHKITQFDL